MTSDDEPMPASDETIFDKAIVLEDAAAREEFLRSACGGEVGQRGRIEGLIRAHERAESMLFLTSRRESDTELVGERPAFAAGSQDSIAEGSGDTIGPFKLLRQVGQGGMGIVWLAGQFEPIKREVALKIISPGVDSKAISARFETERRALALMEHPNIARFLDAGVTGSGRPYFAMEYVDGQQITTFCDRKILTVDQRLRLMVQVCRAVQHAHQKGVLHRDLKPSNILVTSQDGKPVPKVIDFGLAKALSDDADHLGHTVGNQFLGTPAYMSPEQAGIAKDIDARADIFSLGAVLFELLSGTAPIEPEQLGGASFEQVLHLVREAEPPPPSKRIVAQGEELHDIAIHRRTEPGPLARKLRGDLDWIVDKAMSKERGRRYESAEEFAKDLERHLADEPVVAGPPGRIYRASKFIRRYRGVVLASSSAAAALVVAFATSAFMYVRAEVASHDQSVVTQKVSEERAKRKEAQIEAEGLLRFAFENLRDQLEPHGQLEVLGRFVDPAADYFESDEAGSGAGPLEQSQMWLVFGDIRREEGRFAEAAEFYREAKSILTPEQESPTDAELKSLLAAELRLGRLFFAQGQWIEAFRQFHTAEGRLPETSLNEAQRAAILRRMSECQRALENFLAAIELGVRERAIRTRISERTPSDPSAAHSLADAQWFGGRLHSEAGQTQEAEVLLKEAVATLSRVLTEPVVQDSWRKSFFDSSSLLGNLLQRDRPEAALQQYARARRVLQASSTHGVAWESRLAETCRKIGKLHSEAGRNTTAELVYKDSLKHYVAAARLQPSEISFVEGQAKAHLALARIRTKHGRHLGANATAGLELASELLDHDASNEQWFELHDEFRKLEASSRGSGMDEEGGQ